MKHQSYLTRALQARDPRYARVMGALGYDTACPVAQDPVEEVSENGDADLSSLRREYQAKTGKKAASGWSVQDLRDRIAVHGRAAG